jgi:hypothetical protein
MISCGHEAFHHDIQRYGIAIFRNRRKPKRHAAFLRRAACAELINRGLHILGKPGQPMPRHRKVRRWAAFRNSKQ